MVEYDLFVEDSTKIVKKDQQNKHFEYWKELATHSNLEDLVRSEATLVALKVNDVTAQIFPGSKPKNATTGINLDILKISDPDFITKFKKKYPENTTEQGEFSPTDINRPLSAEEMQLLNKEHGIDYVVDCEITDNIYTMNIGHCFQVDPLHESTVAVTRVNAQGASNSHIDILNLDKLNISDYPSIKFYDGQFQKPAMQNHVLYSLPLTLIYNQALGDLSHKPNLVTVQSLDDAAAELQKTINQEIVATSFNNFSFTDCPRLNRYPSIYASHMS